jgi:hypothetical protein
MNIKKILFLFFSITSILGITFLLVTNNQLDNSTIKLTSETSKINIKDSRDSTVYINPINGVKYQEIEKPNFLQNVPLGIMVNNAVPARPQSGLNKADVIYEIVAEGGITRFLAVYLSELPEKVGPIRSAREYYITYIKELGDAMYMHIGYSPQAKEKIEQWNVKSLQNSPNSFYRDNGGNPDIATEHTAYGNALNLFNNGVNNNWNNLKEIRSWSFKNDYVKIDTLPIANYIEINFWYKGDYSGIFKYNKEENNYIRFSGFDENDMPIRLIDQLDKTEVKVKNLIVQFSEEFPIPNDDKNRLDYNLIGSGDALIFRDGRVEKAKWSKENLESRTIYYDLADNEIQFNRGKFWISIVPTRNVDQVIYN